MDRRGNYAELCGTVCIRRPTPEPSMGRSGNCAKPCGTVCIRRYTREPSMDRSGNYAEPCGTVSIRRPTYTSQLVKYAYVRQEIRRTRNTSVFIEKFELYRSLDQCEIYDEPCCANF